MNERRYDCLVVGCGVVGCAVARELSLRAGATVGVVEKEADPVAEASSGNTGHVGSFFYYTEARAPLEYRMTRRSRQLNREWLRRQPNVAAEKRNLLMPIFSDSEMDAAEELLRSARQNGEGGVSIVSAGEVLRLEPNMDVGGRRLLGGLLSADEYLVDTWQLAISYLYSALENGARLHLGREVVECAFDADSGLWTIRVRGGGKTESYTARVIVNCAGNYSDAVHEMISPGAEDPFRITPGKGEYLVFDSRPGENAVVKSLVVPVPSAVTAGVYVFSSLYGNVVVGPTSAAQRSKSDRSCDSAVQDELRARAENLFPSLRGRTVLKSFSGLRPACEDVERHRDYQVRVDPEGRWVTLGGIRSTGASTASALAEMVAERIVPPEKRNRAKEDPVMPKPRNAGDGFVEVGRYKFHVTHPLAQTGIGLLPTKDSL